MKRRDFVTCSSFHPTSAMKPTVSGPITAAPGANQSRVFTKVA